MRKEPFWKETLKTFIVGLFIFVVAVGAAYVLDEAGLLQFPITLGGAGGGSGTGAPEFQQNFYFGDGGGTPVPTPYDVQGTLNAKRAHDATATADRQVRDATREALRETLKTPHQGRE